MLGQNATGEAGGVKRQFATIPQFMRALPRVVVVFGGER